MLPSYADLPFGTTAGRGLRYRYDNPHYTYSDAIFYYSVLRHFRPHRLIEVGSGHSSALALDVNERFLDNQCTMTFIEPFPSLLRSLTADSDLRGRLLVKRLQAIPLELFGELSSGDVLFIDSTHVSRAGSDVNYLLFDVLPALAPGVLVHFHDIFYPFEYPSEWIREGRSWNESYALRAFLQFNRAFRVVLVNTYRERFHCDCFAEHMPLCLQRPFPTGSIWIEHVV